ncbi:MAG: hypothetical protein HC902_03780 [Calothrix sp. SM1_5_4]|nr:hypothetical protein [Calothrix sp. SM1_5_4]
MVCTMFRRFAQVFLVLAASVHFMDRTFAQEQVYRSDVDDLLTLQKVSVLAFTDNLQGIYARPLEAHFISLVEKMHRWDYVPSSNSGPLVSPEELEASAEKSLQVSQGLGADAFFAGRVTKGPNGVSIHLSLFLSKDGKLLSQAILKDYKKFNIGDLNEQIERLLAEVVSRLPYSGRVLSRDGNRVTLNLGTRDGIQTNQLLSVIQIIQAHRHPKFSFLIKTEKEIFGRIKVLKVEETLSFGVVISEKERGAIQKNSKIGPLDFITYSGGETLSLTPPAEDALLDRDDGKIAFGKDAARGNLSRSHPSGKSADVWGWDASVRISSYRRRVWNRVESCRASSWTAKSGSRRSGHSTRASAREFCRSAIRAQGPHRPH